MLESTLQYNASRPSTTATIDGPDLKRMVRGKPPRARAEIGARLVSGKLPFVPNPAQAARIVGTHARLIHEELGHQPKQLTDRAIDRFVVRAGADRVMQALDRYTAPRFAFAVAQRLLEHPQVQPYDDGLLPGSAQSWKFGDWRTWGR